ncbi:MAG: Mur ligase family protein, partial [Alphaproteobacteria bacterium]
MKMVIKAPLANLRRLTGANFLMVEHGAAADVALDDLDKNAKTELWQKSTRELLDAVGWTDSKIAVRSFDGGVTLQVSAPTDALHSGMSLVEAAWDYTNSILAKIPFDLNGVVKDLKKQICDEHSPLEVSLAVRAKGLGLTYLGHDDKISIGLGVGGAVYDVTNLPSADDVEWGKLHDIPIAMVTGTNGKSTTVRLAAAIGQAAGHCVGLSSSDWVRVGGEILDEGDYSGPAGARLAVRDPRVDLGIIETARGGLMRRGLPVPTADVCLLTNIAADHLGTYGIMDVCALADAKFQISQAVKPNGWLVLNADDPELVTRSSDFSGQLSWFGLDFSAVNLQELIAKGGRAAFLQNDFMMLAKDGEVSQVMHVNDFVPALKGAAKFNVYNALGAIALTD